jgi:Phytanoyl-CoA dioxygenase (PhyH)
VIDINPFMNNGYQIIPQAFDAKEINSVGTWLESEMQAAVKELLPLVAPAEGEELWQAIHRFYDRGQHHALSTDLQYALAGQYSLRVRLSEPLKYLLRAPRLREVLHQVFPGQQLRAHMPPMCRFVLPRNRLAGVPPHQDISYNKHITDFITGWVPLVRIDELCGGVRIHEGSANLPELLTDFARDIWLQPLPDLRLRKVDLHMQPGDLLIFQKMVIHESLPNLSDQPRFSIDYRFFGSWETSAKHYLDMESWQVVEPKN